MRGSESQVTRCGVAAGMWDFSRRLTVPAVRIALGMLGMSSGPRGPFPIEAQGSQTNSFNVINPPHLR